MKVRTYTTHEISAGHNSLPTEVFVRQCDYNDLVEWTNQLTVALCEIRDREPNGVWAKELASLALQKDLKMVVQI